MITVEGLRAVVVAAVLRVLAEQVRLQGKDVVQAAVDAPSLEPVVGDHPGVLEVPSQRSPEGTVDASLAPDLGLLQQLQAAVEGELPRAVRADVHSVPSTSTRPAAVIRVSTLLRAGSAYGSAGWPSELNLAGWHGHARWPVPSSHHSSHGRCEQTDETAVTVSPRLKRKAPMPPAWTRLPCASTRSLTAATSIQRPLSGLMVSPPARTAFGTSALPARPPLATPAARPSPATSAVRRVTHPSSVERTSVRARRLRNAGCIRCGPCRAAARRAAAVIADLSSASPPRSLSRRPFSRSETILSTRFSRLFILPAAPWPPRAEHAAA